MTMTTAPHNLVDTTKVTSSTPADNSLPRVVNGEINNTIKEDTGVVDCLVLLSRQPSSIKQSRTINRPLVTILLNQSGF
jgi:hypothetical protein